MTVEKGDIDFKDSYRYPRIAHDYYARGIGRVLDQYFYTGQPGYFQAELVKYGLKP